MSEYIDSERISKFYEPLILKYRVAQEVKKQADLSLASDFNFFDIIGPNENKISDIIKLLIEPNGKHGQGNIFLKLFIDSIPKNILELHGWNNLDFDEIKVSVHREYSTNFGRRIDLLIQIETDNGRHAIAIENKPWAIEQKDQLNDYSKYLNSQYNDFYLLIYLPGTNLLPTSLTEKDCDNLYKTGKFLPTTYTKLLIDWLIKCHKECEAEKVRYFVKDFIKWINHNFQEVVVYGSSDNSQLYPE